MQGLNINIFEDGQVIHVDDSRNGYNVSAVSEKNFTDMNVSKNEFNSSVWNYLNSLEHRWMYNFMEENTMIKERCLLDLLEEEKKAVSDYNSLIDNYGFVISHYTELSKEHPEMKEYCDRELNDRLSKNKELEKLAMQKITSVRLEIKKYLSNL